MKKLPKPLKPQQQAPKARAKSAPKPAPATKAKPRKRHAPASRAHAEGPSSSNLSEALFRRTFDAAPIGAAIVGLDFTFTQVNTAFCQLLGYTEKELLGRSFTTITHPDDIAASRAGIEHLLTGQATTFEQEKRYIRNDGGIIWGLASVSVVRDNANQPLYLFPIIQDITARKKAEHALLESEKRLQLITAAVTDYIYTVNVVNGQAVNTTHGSGCLRITGYRPDEFANDPFLWFRMIAEGDRPMVERQARQILLGTDPAPIEHRIIHKNGSERWIRNTFVAHHDAVGVLTSYEGLIQDITARKQTEEALRESELRYRTLANSGQALIWTSGLDKNCDYFNETWLTFTGRRLEQEIGTGWTEGVHPDDLAQCVETYVTAFDRRERFSMDYRVRRHDGEYRWIQDDGSPRFDRQGNFLGYIGHCLDITDQTQAEAALLTQAKLHAAELAQRVHERTAELEATNKELEAFSYSVSHDLRAPLRAIDGFSAILSADYMSRLDPEGQRLLGIICAEAKRMGLLIDDLLAFSRMNRLALQTAEIDMTALAQTIFDECIASAPDRQLQIKLQPLPTAQGDRPMIRQVLMNLIANAIKYTRPKPLAEIEIGGHEEAGEAIYYIKDNGVGFDQRYADKLFGVFQRLHTEEEFEGTGVGLALVQRVIHRHGGRVWAEAKVNAGATFYFALPTKH